MPVHAAMLWSPGPMELIILLVIIMMFFGVGKLPEVAKTFGQSLKEFKKAQNTDALDVTPTTQEIPQQSTAGAAEVEPVLAGGAESSSPGT